MNPKLPIEAKSTGRLLRSVFPNDFKLVSDQNSNGYKYVNLLYGVEIDNLEKNVKEAYNDSFFSSIDLTRDFALYEVNLTGTPITPFLNTDGSIKIKITSQTEFEQGEPTRIVEDSCLPLPMYYLVYSGTAIPSGAGFQNGFDIGFNTPCWSSISGIMGLEYIRSDGRGSGYLIVTSDINQEDAYHSGMYPVFAIEVGANLKTSVDYINTYGIYNGIKDISYSGILSNEILYPINSITLSGQYPLSREIEDDTGLVCSIDHYTPYFGWTRDYNGNVVAKTSVSGDYYYTSTGTKIYYRTALNNPYGYNNYTKAYLDLLNIPISGTLKVFDVDILDFSGNAIEIPSTGKDLYYYKSLKMNTGLKPNEGESKFDPIYLGYESTVPSGYNLGSDMEGSGCTLFKTTTWGYMHEGNYFDDNTLSWIDGTGLITNKIWISGYHSRYLIEYKTKLYNSVQYVSSSNNNGVVSLDTSAPLLTTDLGNIKQIDYEFSKDPTLGSENTKVISLDGTKFRPGSKIDQISYNVPVILTDGQGPLIGPIYQNINKLFAGYTNEFVPQIEPNRYYILNCLFNSNNLIEQDTTINNFDLIYYGNNQKININYNKRLGKKIIDSGDESYFYIDDVIRLIPYTFFQFDCKIRTSQSGQLMELYDTDNSKYLTFGFEDTGRLKIQTNGIQFYSRENINFNSNEKSFILKYNEDDISGEPVLRLYYKEKTDPWYRIINLSYSNVAPLTISDFKLSIYKNCSIDIGCFKIYYEVI